MIKLSYDNRHNTVFIEFIGIIDTPQMEDYLSKLPGVIPQPTDGFTLLVDLSQTRHMDPQIRPFIRKAMDLLNKSGVERIIRVIPKGHKDIGLNIMSAFHYSSKVKTITVGTLQEAQERLHNNSLRKNVDIKRSGTRPLNKGLAEYFTGVVHIDTLVNAPTPARVVATSVTFEPGARTAWHTHPLGQTLIVTAGLGRAQRWGGPVEEIRPGDVVWFPPGEKHWHGASPAVTLTHIAIQEQLDGKTADWLEKVSDEQYYA